MFDRDIDAAISQLVEQWNIARRPAHDFLHCDSIHAAQRSLRPVTWQQCELPRLCVRAADVPRRFAGDVAYGLAEPPEDRHHPEAVVG